jgi:broad specificity phosphatase PhoE
MDWIKSLLPTFTKENQHNDTKDPNKHISNCTVHWVRHAESCSNIAWDVEFDYESWWLKSDKIRHPPLSHLGIAQSIHLGYHLMNTDHKGVYSGYYVSPSIRTIMTAIFSLRMLDNADAITLTITPWISEQLNFASIVGQDRQNGLPTPNNLKIMVRRIKEWIKETYDKYYFDIHLYKLFEDITTIFNDIITSDFQLLMYQSYLEEIIKINNNIKQNAYKKIIIPNETKKKHEFMILEDIHTNDSKSNDSSESFIGINTGYTFTEIINLCRALCASLATRLSTSSLGNKLEQIKDILAKTEIMKTEKFLQGPTIDFTYYEQEYSKLFPNNEQQIYPNNQEYYNKFLDYINGKPETKTESSIEAKYTKSQQIIVFTHGGAIQKILRLIEHPINTSIYHTKNNDIFRLYCPNKGLIYTTKHCINDNYYGELPNDIKLNTCNKDSYMGKIFTEMDDLFQKTFNHEETNKLNETKVIENKYLKYKNKYINLKKKLNTFII